MAAAAAAAAATAKAAAPAKAKAAATTTVPVAAAPVAAPVAAKAKAAASKPATTTTAPAAGGAGVKRKRAPEVPAPPPQPVPVTQNWAQLKGKLSAAWAQRTGGTVPPAGSAAPRHTAVAAAAAPTPAPPAVDIGCVTPAYVKKLTAEQKADPARKVAVLGPFDGRPLSAAAARYVALDCEMVGVGRDGATSALAQVVCVDYNGVVLYETYVAVKAPVTDYRTAFSGVRPEHLVGAPDFETVQRRVSALLRDKIIVGHSLKNDMRALLLGHSWTQTRDTATYRPLCRLTRGGHVKPRRLKHLAAEHLGIVIQEGEHEPAEDARAALALYRAYAREWEASLLAPAAAGAGGDAPAAAAAAAGAGGKAGERDGDEDGGGAGHRSARKERHAKRFKRTGAPPQTPATAAALVPTGGGGAAAAAAAAAASHAAAFFGRRTK